MAPLQPPIEGARRVGAHATRICSGSPAAALALALPTLQSIFPGTNELPGSMHARKKAAPGAGPAFLGILATVRFEFPLETRMKYGFQIFLMDAYRQKYRQKFSLPPSSAIALRCCSTIQPPLASLRNRWGPRLELPALGPPRKDPTHRPTQAMLTYLLPAARTRNSVGCELPVRSPFRKDPSHPSGRVFLRGVTPFLPGTPGTN